MNKVMQTPTTGVPDAHEELASPDKTLTQRRNDILAYHRPPRHLQQPHRNSQRPA